MALISPSPYESVTKIESQPLPTVMTFIQPPPYESVTEIENQPLPTVIAQTTNLQPRVQQQVTSDDGCLDRFKNVVKSESCYDLGWLIVGIIAVLVFFFLVFGIPLLLTIYR